MRLLGPTLLACSLALLQMTRPGTAEAQRAPTPPEVFEAAIPDLQAAMASGATTSVGLVDAYLARIEAYDRSGPRLNSVILLNPNARAEAEALDRERAQRGPRGPLHGIPVLVKDNYDVSGLPTTAGSVALAGMLPPDDATQVRRLREAGAVILGKTNLHELAYGITTISSLGGQTLNPYDPLRNPGGSSGGTGAAVAASFAAIGWGSDTCGSIRIPSSHHALFGLRPTKGLSSIDGILPLAHTQDVGGPLARTARDLAIGLDATVGADPADPATRVLAGRTLPRFVESLDAGALRGVRLGLLLPYWEELDPQVERTARAAVERMRALGAEVVEVAAPGLTELLAGSSVITHEFKFDLMDYLAATPGAPVRSLAEILERGLYHTAVETPLRNSERAAERDTEAYRAALARREPAAAAVIGMMEAAGVVALVHPTIRQRPMPIGEAQPGSLCQLSATTGMPALSFPAGFTETGLPVGLELLGRPFSDARLLAMGYAYEQAERPRRPPPTTPPLVDGRAPGAVAADAAVRAGAAVARGEFTFDPILGTLAYELSVSGVPADRVHAVTLHRGEQGPVVHRLLEPGATSGSGLIALSPRDREDLRAGTLHLRLLTRDHPGGAGPVPLRFPE